MAGDSFFDEQTEQSLIKTRIVEKYFWAWAKVMIPNAKKRGSQIAYIDLFAGPGRYGNGSKSTPIKVLETAIADPDMRNMLKTLFNDANSQYTNSLQSAINAIPGIQTLKYQPIVTNLEIGKNTIELFDVPTLFFLDPFGYKGLSLQLINSFVKNWGCDCLFFFNYNRISMGLGNPLVEEHINALFEKRRADELRNKLKNNSNDRENLIVTYICESLKEMDIKYVRNFRFKHEKNQRTSHHLIFVSKNLKGYNIIKDIMAKESSDQNQGVPSFEYNPAKYIQRSLFEIPNPLDELEQMLLDEFAGKTITMEEIYLQHHVGKAYIKKNYKAALKNLESQGKITAEKPANQRQKKGEITFGDGIRVTFPPKQ
jgi:three-Cys-motif partner protein